MATTTTTSKQFSLNVSDAVKGFVIAVLTPVLYLVQELIPGWNIPPIAKAAIAAAVAYIIKNFLTPSAIVITDAPQSQIDAVNAGRMDVKLTLTKG